MIGVNGTDDRLADVLISLDQHVRRNPTNQWVQDVGAENDHGVDHVQRADQRRPLLRGNDGSALSFGDAHAGVVVNPDDEPVAVRLGVCERREMPDVQDIEDPVSEADSQPLAPPLSDETCDPGLSLDHGKT